MNFRRKKNYFVFIIVILFFSIGYAYLNSTLIINGNSEVVKNTWDIHFDNIQFDDSSATSNLPEMTKDTITFSTTLARPGEYYRFNVDVVNAGTITAEIDKIELEGNITEENEQYFNLLVQYEDGTSISESQYLASESKKKLNVSIEYRDVLLKDELPAENIALNFTIKLIYKQPDYEPDAQLNVLGQSWSQRPGISMYSAVDRRSKECINGSNCLSVDDYFVYDMDFGKEVFLDKYGKVSNLKKLMIKGGKTYNSIAYVSSSKITNERIMSGDHQTIFIYPVIYAEEQYNGSRDAVAVFVDSSDTYVDVVHAAFLVEILSAEFSYPDNFASGEQEVIEEYVLGFPSGQDYGCGSSPMASHRFYAFLDEEENLIEINKNVSNFERSSLVLIDIPESEMTYEEAKEFILYMVSDYVGNSD